MPLTLENCFKYCRYLISPEDTSLGLCMWGESVRDRFSGRLLNLLKTVFWIVTALAVAVLIGHLN